MPRPTDISKRRKEGKTSSGTPKPRKRSKWTRQRMSLIFQNNLPLFMLLSRSPNEAWSKLVRATDMERGQRHLAIEALKKRGYTCKAVYIEWEDEEGEDKTS